MLKSLAVAGTIALSALAMSSGADAKTRVGVYFGVPFYDYQAGPGWRYSEGYGWYDYGRYGEFGKRNRGGRFISCNEARRLVDRSGYNAVRTVECGAPTYTFRAINRNGKRVTVYVNARNGAVWRG